MRRPILPFFLSAFALCTVSAAAVSAPPAEINLTAGWQITQDVRELGEQAEWYKPDFVADWQPIDRLAHLQLLLARQPYFGRVLRSFNDSPWWYRLEFASAAAAHATTLRFEGVDYFAKVWVNGVLLGEHEGYASPFEFEVGKLLRRDAPNVLLVKVSSPWDHTYINSGNPTYFVQRNLIKGSYEHADTFVQRDVNPIGIWQPVKLIAHGDLREIERPTVTTALAEDHRKADVKIAWALSNDGPSASVEYVVRIRFKETNTEVATLSRSVKLQPGANTFEQTVMIPAPKLWSTWDRGGPNLYEASLEVIQRQGVKVSSSAIFGVHSVELHRTPNETRFFLNGQPLYLRGTSYWPDLYLSNMSRSRYERDLQAAVRAGVNAIRVHVHSENPEFYELCDRMGLAVIQDSDLNWTFPTDPKFVARAVRHVGEVVRQLRNHPSIIGWIAMNEVFWGQEARHYPPFMDLKKSDAKAIGGQLTAEMRRLDPTRPVIENSSASDDLASGDTHDYRGSLDGGAYFDIAAKNQDQLGAPPKLVTEFGIDAPPAYASLRAVPELSKRLKAVLPRVAELQDYQYYLIKYYIEHYRIQKYAPNAGYFQFMWIDFSPQSFYGIYDYWGVPKAEGLGGGLRAMLESNQPVGIFMEHDTQPHALHVVNDTSQDLGQTVAHWRVSSSTEVVLEGSQPVQVGPDSHQRIRDFSFPMKPGETYQIALELTAHGGKVLVHNTYVNPFHPPPLPKGYPNMDDELGMRTWDTEK